MTWDFGYREKGPKKMDDIGFGKIPESSASPGSSGLSILFFDPDDGTNSFPDMIGLNGAECQRQGRTATGENLAHVHCKIPATRGAKVLSLGLKENKHDVFSFSENLLLCSPFFLYLHFGCQILDPAR